MRDVTSYWQADCATDFLGDTSPLVYLTIFKDFKGQAWNYGGPQLSRQNQKPHDKNKNITAKPKTSRQKQNTSRQNQIPHGKTKYFTAKTKDLSAKAKQSYFGFSVKYLVLPRGFWFCREVFRFCREVFGFAVRYFVFAVRFLVLPWCFCFCREVFGFAVTVVGHHSFMLAPWNP